MSKLMLFSSHFWEQVLYNRFKKDIIRLTLFRNNSMLSVDLLLLNWVIPLYRKPEEFYTTNAEIPEISTPVFCLIRRPRVPLTQFTAGISDTVKNRRWTVKFYTQTAGFESARGNPIEFRVQRLNHSATTADNLF